MKVYDNFLKDKDFKLIQHLFMGNKLPWYYNDGIAKGQNHEDEGPDGYQFVHSFFSIAKPFTCSSTKFHTFLDPLWNKLSPKYIIRVKANLRPRTEKLVVSNCHTDTEITQAKTCVFYLNSNDGYTLFKDGTKVESVENRLVLFDSQTQHAGTSCTDKRKRVVLNINYIPVEMNGQEQLPL